MSATDAPQPERLPAGIPGWRRAPCLGCGGTLKENRPPWVALAGTRDGTFLMAYPLGPERIEVTLDTLPNSGPLFLLGVAHRRCRELARSRLLRGDVELADELPTIEVAAAPHLLGTRGMPHVDPERCPFCWGGDGPTNELTDEDVFPLWLQRTMNELAGQPSGAHPNPWPEVRVPVCANCNNRWLSVLENDTSVIVKPMLVAGGATLDQVQRATLGTWATKIALLLDCYGTNPVVPHEYLKALATEGSPSPGTAVWLGAHTGTLAMKTLGDVLTERNPDGSEIPTGIRVTFSIGRLVFLVVVRFAGRDPFPAPSAAIARALVQLWPPVPGDAQWPAGNFSFGVDGAERLREMSAGEWVFSKEPPADDAA
jgi:hypothetical protein